MLSMTKKGAQRFKRVLSGSKKALCMPQRYTTPKSMLFKRCGNQFQLHFLYKGRNNEQE